MPKESSAKHYYLGISDGHVDPAVALVCDGEVVAFAEEERLIRYKHAPYLYPARALSYCLDHAKITISDVRAVTINWDIDAYSNGAMSAFYQALRKKGHADPATISWQDSILQRYNATWQQQHHELHWRKLFGDVEFPPVIGFPHHFTHALHAAIQSPFDEALVLSLDGSGDHQCTVMWKFANGNLESLQEILMPHSLGWFYAAFTEYLGFEAYDGEYKVMGMAAYGRPNEQIQSKLAQLLKCNDDGTYELDLSYIHQGAHSYSGRYTDRLTELFEQKPRRDGEPIEDWHLDLAFAVQARLELAAGNLVGTWVRKTGIRNLCISGGVGHNVKMNSHLFALEEICDVFPQPLCNDGGAAAGSALAAWYAETARRPKRLTTLALGPQFTADEVRDTLLSTKAPFVSYDGDPDGLVFQVAAELAAGRIVGWFQGRMEAGPRALGQRSILADPRSIESRDRVNQVIKFREEWRPFCPSMLAERLPNYFCKFTEAPFMAIAFKANDRLVADAPGIVHIDQTSRVQAVYRDRTPLYYSLIEAFEARTGVPVLLNTSFNIKGEPIVCNVRDALRTFWSTGLDVLVVENCIVYKPQVTPTEA